MCPVLDYDIRELSLIFLGMIVLCRKGYLLEGKNSGKGLRGRVFSVTEGVPKLLVIL